MSHLERLKTHSLNLHFVMSVVRVRYWSKTSCVMIADHKWSSLEFISLEWTVCPPVMAVCITLYWKIWHSKYYAAILLPGGFSSSFSPKKIVESESATKWKKTLNNWEWLAFQCKESFCRGSRYGFHSHHLRMKPSNCLKWISDHFMLIFGASGQ